VPAPASSASGLTPDGRRLLPAIDELPEEEWKVFDLLRIQGMKQPGAAQVLGVSAVTVKPRSSRFVERMLTVVATCRQQGINVLDDLTRCLYAHLDGQPAPSLRPSEPVIRAARSIIKPRLGPRTATDFTDTLAFALSYACLSTRSSPWWRPLVATTGPGTLRPVPSSGGPPCRPWPRDTNLLKLHDLWLRTQRAPADRKIKLQRLPVGAGDNRKRQPRFERTGTRTRASGSCEWE
jgi:Sigma-70, region 4